MWYVIQGEKGSYIQSKAVFFGGELDCHCSLSISSSSQMPAGGGRMEGESAGTGYGLKEEY